MAFKPFRMIKNGIKSTFNINQWIGTEPLETGTRSIITVVKFLFKKKKKNTLPDDFESYVEKLNINNQQLAEKAQHFLYHFYLYFIFIVLGLLYIIFLFYIGKILFAVLTLSILGLAVYKCYKSYGYYYQIKKRCFQYSAKELFKALLKGEIK